MSTTRLLLATLAFQVFVAQTPARDTPAKPQVGNASIAGRVITNDADARPIRRVILLLTGGNLSLGRQTTTDDEGRFVLSALPAGRYTLTAWRNGFVRDTYGNKRPGIGNGQAIVISTGERLEVTFRMTRAAAIGGTVMLQQGQPISGVRVQALQYQTIAGRRVLRPAATGGVSPVAGTSNAADNRGVYRIYGLAPGEYVIVATSPSGSSGIRQVSADEVQWAVRQLKEPAAYSAPPPLDVSSRIGYAPVYYPGTTDPSASVAMPVGPGEDRTGVDFPLLQVPVARVEGRIFDTDGQPARSVENVILMSSGGLVEANNLWVATAPDGTFRADGVPPGRYMLVAQARTRAMPSASQSTWATVDLDVNGRDVSDLVVTLQPGVTVSGRITFRGSTPPGDPRRVNISLVSSRNDGMAMPSSSANATPDGKFAIAGVPPGRYLLRAVSNTGAANSQWTARSAFLGDRDWIDEPIEVRLGQNISDVVVTFTDRPPEITGTVYDGSGQPTPEFFIVLFAADTRFWTPGSRRVGYARPATNGAYRVANLPPGEYYLCAVNDLDTENVTDSGFLESLVGRSIKLTLGEGEKKLQNVRLAQPDWKQ